MVRPTALTAVVDSLEAVVRTASSSSAMSLECYGKTEQHNISREHFFAATSITMATTVTADVSSDIHSRSWFFYNFLVMYKQTLKHDESDTKVPWTVACIVATVSKTSCERARNYKRTATRMLINRMAWEPANANVQSID